MNHDEREAVKSVTEKEADLLLKALEFVPEDKRDWSPGGAATTALGIVLHCGAVHRMVAAILSGGEQQGGEWPTTRDYPTAEAVKGYYEDSKAQFYAAMDSLKQEEFSTSRRMPWGQEMEVRAILWLPSYHDSYHCGQINYIQLLLGDKEFHF